MVKTVLHKYATMLKNSNLLQKGTTYKPNLSYKWFK